jgi:hypothetical protein
MFKRTGFEGSKEAVSEVQKNRPSEVQKMRFGKFQRSDLTLPEKRCLNLSSGPDF